MSKRCVVCGKRPVDADSFPLCATCDKSAPSPMDEPAVITWTACRVRAIERRKSKAREEKAWHAGFERCMDDWRSSLKTKDAVRNAKARRPR